MALFAALVSTVFSVLMRDSVREQLRLGALLFGGFMVSALVLGWLLYPMPL
jgi:hypothetical protein